jgi:hypothetical protein
MTSFKDFAKVVSLVFLVSLAIWGFVYCFLNAIPKKLNEAEDKAKQTIKETPLPRFTIQRFELCDSSCVNELIDSKTNITYLIYRDYRGTVILSKEPTSATKVTLLEELK